MPRCRCFLYLPHSLPVFTLHAAGCVFCTASELHYTLPVTPKSSASVGQARMLECGYWTDTDSQCGHTATDKNNKNNNKQHHSCCGREARFYILTPKSASSLPQVYHKIPTALLLGGCARGSPEDVLLARRPLSDRLGDPGCVETRLVAFRLEGHISAEEFVGRLGGCRGQVRLSEGVFWSEERRCERVHVSRAVGACMSQRRGFGRLFWAGFFEPPPPLKRLQSCCCRCRSSCERSQARAVVVVVADDPCGVCHYWVSCRRTRALRVLPC